MQKKKKFLYCYFCCKYPLQKPFKVFFSDIFAENIF